MPLVIGSSLFFALGVWLSGSSQILMWLVGQVILAFSALQWFVILHECGHGTMFPTRRWNMWCGHLASFLCFVPFLPWMYSHRQHHIWTGWKDLDPTTSQVVASRQISKWQERFLNTCWKMAIPIFSALYRWNNFWNIARLARLFPKPALCRHIKLNIAVMLIVYMSLGWVFPEAFFRYGAFACYLHLVISEPVMLSQHTHIPQRYAQERQVLPFPPDQQSQFTRSLIVPPVISRFILFNFEAHELHHAYPKVPGYYLHLLQQSTTNRVHWWVFLKTARSLRATDFLFQTRDETGIKF